MKLGLRHLGANPATFRPLAIVSFWTAPASGGSAIRSEIGPEILKSAEVTFVSAIADWGGSDFKFSWAPSGKAIYFARTLGGARNIWRMSVDPQALRAIAIEGKKLVFRGIPGGNYNVWKTSLSDGHEAPIIADEYEHESPQWSPDGTQLAYTRGDSSKGTRQVMLWSSQSRNEETLAESSQSYPFVYDWSPDGEWLLMTTENASGRDESWLLPVAARPHAERAARRIVSDPACNLYEEHFSPNGRWIAFLAIRSRPGGTESTIYVMSAAGGPWIRITEGKHWDDKLRWSPDGKVIYFLSERAGFLNVWGIRFDSARGRPVSEPFPVTAFSSPRLMVAKLIASAAISLAQDRLVMTVTQASGNIWVLDNVDR